MLIVKKTQKTLKSTTMKIQVTRIPPHPEITTDNYCINRHMKIGIILDTCFCS